MNRNKSFLIRKLDSSVIFVIMFCSILIGSGLNAQRTGFYQLKIYNLENASQAQRVDNYLRNAYLPALHRFGILKAGVFKPVESDPQAGKKVYVLIPFKSLKQFEMLAGKLNSDKQFQTDGKEYINAKYDNPPYQRIESILLKAFRDMPEMRIPDHATPHSQRVYELRSYQGPTEKYFRNKLEMFNDGGEINLFNKLNFKPIFYGEVVSGSIMPNLMYMTTFADEASRLEHWKSFSSHPDWKALKENEKYKNNVSKVDIFLLQPTDYSDL